MRRGMLFTVALGLLSMTLLSLSVNSVFIRNIDELTLDTCAGSYRADDAFRSIEYDLRDIIENTSGMKISYVGSNITFNESLPNPVESGNYKDVLDAYSEFGQNQSATVTFSLTALRNKLKFLIKPQGLNYTHTTFGDREVVVEHSSDVEKYNVTAYTPENITGCDWNQQAGDSDITLAVNIRSNYPGSVNCTQARIIDENLETVLDVNAYNFTVNMSGGKLYIKNNWADIVNVSTAIYLDKSNKIRGIYLSKGLARTSLPDYNITKNGNLRFR